MMPSPSPLTGDYTLPREQAPARPFWVPCGVDLDELPADLRAAVLDILAPIYRDLVLAAATGLEKSVGLTVAHLAWLELLDAYRLGQQQITAQDYSAASEDRQAEIDRHLRVVGGKLKAGSLLLRVRDWNQRWGVHPEIAALRAAPSPSGPIDDSHQQGGSFGNSGVC